METAPFFADIAHGPAGGTAHWLTTDDGIRIRVGQWPLDGANGTVLIFTGRTEYVEKYGDAAREFHARGYACLAIDWRGQGLSDRLLADPAIGHVDTFDAYQIDVKAVMEYAARAGLPGPYYMLAHSMGGCIGLRTLYGDWPIKAVAFSAPMWGILVNRWLSPFTATITGAARRLGKSDMMIPGQSRETYVLREKFDLNTLTRDRTMWERMEAQARAQPDLSLGGPSFSWLSAAMEENEALAALPSPDVPCLTFLGGAEKIVDSVAVEERMARWPGGDLMIVEGGEHEVMLDLPQIRTQVFDAVAAHFAAHP